MNRKQRRAQKRAGTITSPKAKPDFAKLGAVAYKQGDMLRALEFYARAVEESPKHHDNMVHLAHILSRVTFKSFNPKIKSLVFMCLNEPGIDYQCLSKPWFSLLMCDPEFKPLQAVINNQDCVPKELKVCLKIPFLLQGLSKLTVYDVRFEKALLRIKEEMGELGASYTKAFESYCERTEYVFCDQPKDEGKAYKIDETIETLGMSEDDVSKFVRQHYEENPYPRWSSIHVQTPLQSNLGKAHDHLIAGCGTGYGTCATALMYPNVKITALDLSLASLTYAKSKAAGLGLKNVMFYQADILNLDALDQEYDVIESSGVLHHMNDPIEGWRALLSKLKEGGRMHIGLYSETGRRDVIAARALIAEQGYESSHEGIRQAREYISALPEDHPACPVTNRRDFYSLSDCRDLLFHGQEHRFTIPKIKDALEHLDLKFEGFDNQAVTFKTLDEWHKFELEHPDTFTGMYQFWCSRA